MKFTSINLRDLLIAGHEKLAEAHTEREIGKAGRPRVGSAGCVSDTGQIYGTCHRKAMLRQLGVESAIDFATRRMWQAGFGNEWSWEQILKASGFDGEVITQDSLDVTIDGVPLPVGGTPDVILKRNDGTEVGVELKSVQGYTTFASVYFDKKPKNDNLAQAAMYSALRDTDYILAYSCGHWTKLMFHDKKKWNGKFGSVPAFDVIFYLGWDNDRLYYRHEAETEWVKTEFTKQGLLDYYRLVEELKQKKELGPRPLSDYADGSAHKYGPEADCGLCPFKAACENYDTHKDFDSWLDQAKTSDGGED